MAEEKSFLGRGWSFPVTFNKSLGKVNMVSDEIDIRQSLQIYLATRRGERLLRRAEQRAERQPEQPPGERRPRRRNTNRRSDDPAQ